MVLRIVAMSVLAWSLAGLTAASADHAPVIVIPGKRGVPVIINGRDASWGVAYGDWGLSRPGHVTPTVIYRDIWVPSPCCPHRAHRRPRPVVKARPFYHYFPGGTIAPRLGRLEHWPDRPPAPTPEFFRSWSTESTRTPATENQAPAIIVAPAAAERQRRSSRRQNRPVR